jgi:hypothetical protein
MSIAYTPVGREVQFAKAHRQDAPVHRVRRAQCARSSETGSVWYVTTWLCGGSSIDALLVDDPAEFSYTCERCDVMLTSAIVYRCYSADGQLLYIGSCALWSSREAMHKAQTRWWPEVARVDKEPQPNLGVAKQAEKAAIGAEAPLYNKVHNVKRFRRDGHAFVPVEEAA